MAKMYYSEEETCQKLGVDQDGLMDQFVNTAKLQMYQDGAKHVYKSGDVDKLAASLGTSAGGMDLNIDADAINLSELDDATEVSAGGKEDTVITSEGISIFDDEDLQIETGSALSDTAPAPNIDDEVALGGVGSGSGLLDLTRESDDTSLGADLDLLDNLDMEGMGGSGLGSGLVEAGEAPDTSMSTIASPSVSYEPPTFVEAIDSSSGMFTGLLVGACVAGFICLMAGLAAMTGDRVPGYLSAMQANMGAVVGALAVFSVIAGGAGMVIGKAFQNK